MSTPEPTLHVGVDVTNPGQFFACCGLLELAARIDPDATGQFEHGCFLINGDVSRVLDRFFQCDVTVDTSATSKSDDDGESDDESDGDPHRGRTYPMTLRDPFNLRLDWWNDEEARRQRLKTWTAGQHVTDLLLGYHKGKKGRKYIPSMRERFAEAVKQFPHDWLREPLPIEVPMAFSYDSRLSRNNALDLGHVANSTMAFSPAVDVLTLVGLQRFRPLMLETWARNLYCTWSQPLPVEIAAVTALGLIPQLIDACFDFPIKRRDAQGRFKLFGHAQPVRRPNV
ncbi:MAG: type I-U CRISPR-associated protein Cas8c [Acidobacteriota bacterium]